MRFEQSALSSAQKVNRHVHCQAGALPDEIDCGATVSQLVPVPDV